MYFFLNEYLFHASLEKRQLYFNPLIYDILHILTQKMLFYLELFIQHPRQISRVYLG